jgi:hypothetical protein
MTNNGKQGEGNRSNGSRSRQLSRRVLSFVREHRVKIGIGFLSTVAVVLFFVAVISKINQTPVTPPSGVDSSYYEDFDSDFVSDDDFSPEEKQERDFDNWLVDSTLASYTFCDTMESPAGIFFPLVNYRERLFDLTRADFAEYGELGQFYADCWHENQVERRVFKEQFLKATPAYANRLRSMTLSEFEHAALNWWFSAIGVNDYSTAWAEADQPLPAEIDFETLYYVAQVISIGAGSDFIDLDTKIKVGQAFLNRVADSRFPDSPREVFYQAKQYDISKLGAVVVNEQNFEAAWQLVVEGTRPLQENIVCSGLTPIGHVYESAKIEELDVTIYFSDGN